MQKIDNICNKIALTGTWKQLSDFGGPGRSGAFGFAIGNKGYVIGGQGSSSFLKDFWEYDPSTDKWTRKADYPGEGIMGLMGFGINNKGYVGTGSGIDSVNVPLFKSVKDFYEYDPSTDKWTRKADFAGGERSGMIAFSINGIGYTGLGADVNARYTYDVLGGFKDFWKYDMATDTWMQVGDYPENISASIGFLCNGRGYAGLGGISNNFWQYNPLTDGWIKKADFTGVNGGPGCQFVIGTNAYVGFGSTSVQIANGMWVPELLNDIWEYNTLTDKWTQKTSFPESGRVGLVSFSINGVGYVGTGDSPDTDRHSDFWKFTP
jgi:N-acetylneuraminic acid mutarotase